jgi:uncharacterized protein YndB with AHSA1/START domain
MSSVTRIVETTPDRVWEVLSDGWLFPLWVVGAARIRDVEETWPEVGSRAVPSCSPIPKEESGRFVV